MLVGSKQNEFHEKNKWGKEKYQAKFFDKSNLIKI